MDRIVIVIFTLFFLGLSQACSNLPEKDHSVAENPEVERLSQLVAQQRDQIQKLENQNLVLRTKLSRVKKSGISPSVRLALDGLKQLFQQGRFTEVLKEVNDLLRGGTEGQLTAELLELKGETLQKLQLPSFASDVWREILRDHPKTSQARRAQMMLDAPLAKIN